MQNSPREWNFFIQPHCAVLNVRFLDRSVQIKVYEDSLDFHWIWTTPWYTRSVMRSNSHLLNQRHAIQVSCDPICGGLFTVSTTRLRLVSADPKPLDKARDQHPGLIWKHQTTPERGSHVAGSRNIHPSFRSLVHVHFLWGLRIQWIVVQIHNQITVTEFSVGSLTM